MTKIENKVYHKSVLVDEVVKYLAPKPGGVYVDCTFGGGGHTRAILQAEPKCKVIAFDWDKVAIEKNGPALLEEFGNRLEIVWGNFSHIYYLLKDMGIKEVDGILADFGTSQYQITEQAGFSFSRETPLDMRMSVSHGQVTAYWYVNRAPESDLVSIFSEYGQERYSRRIARAICEYRQHKDIKTTLDLAEIIKRAVPSYKSKIHPATRVFQALRIVVNKELEHIKTLLLQSVNTLSNNGRIVCISFHSLEDRIVKQFFKEHKSEFEILTPKVVVPTEEEVHRNPSSRSSKLRAAERHK